MGYLLLKVLHIASVALFVGNIVTGVFWKLHGDGKGDLRAKEQALSGVIASDRLFTVPGVLLIIVTGVWMASMTHIRVLAVAWTLWGIILFTISGLMFTMRVQPLQRRMLANVRAGLADQWDAAAYRKMSSAWNWWGGIATALPLAVIALMVLKPS